MESFFDAFRDSLESLSEKDFDEYTYKDKSGCSFIVFPDDSYIPSSAIYVSEYNKRRL